MNTLKKKCYSVPNIWLCIFHKSLLWFLLVKSNMLDIWHDGFNHVCQKCAAVFHGAMLGSGSQNGRPLHWHNHEGSKTFPVDSLMFLAELQIILVIYGLLTLCSYVCWKGLSTQHPGRVCPQNPVIHRSALSLRLQSTCHPAVSCRHWNTTGARAPGPVSSTHSAQDAWFYLYYFVLFWRLHQETVACEVTQTSHWSFWLQLMCKPFFFLLCVDILASWKRTTCWQVFSWRWESIPQPRQLWRTFCHALFCKKIFPIPSCPF